MVDEPTAGKRFSTDLRRIREERGVSIDEIHSKTRIARTLIESFEDGRLYTHESYNRVYLRSFVEAYAEAIGISVQRALEGLEAVLEETYEGGLADEYIHAPDGSEASETGTRPTSHSGDPREGEEEFSNAPSAGGPEGRGGIVGPPRAVGEEEGEGEDDTPSVPSESPPDAAAVADESEDDRDASSGAPPPRQSESSEGEASDADDEEAPEEDRDEEAPDASDSGVPSGLEEETTASPFSQADDTADAQPDAPAAEMGEGGIVGEPTPLGGGSEQGSSVARSESAEPSGQGGTAQPSAPWDWFSGDRRLLYAAVGLAIVVLGGILVGSLFFSSGESPSQDEAPTPVSDTAATTPTDTAASEPQRPPPADLTLGETLHLTVRATANVSNLRIRRDDDLRRPYWIENGEANVFPFQDRVALQNELGDVELYLEGYPYPIPDDTAGGIEITRSQAEAFADTLRGAPASLTVTPDTIPVGGPAE